MILEFRRPAQSGRCERCKAWCRTNLCASCADDWRELTQVTDCLPYETWLTIQPGAGLVIGFGADGDYWYLNPDLCPPSEAMWGEWEWGDL